MNVMTVPLMFFRTAVRPLRLPSQTHRNRERRRSSRRPRRPGGRRIRGHGRPCELRTTMDPTAWVVESCRGKYGLLPSTSKVNSQGHMSVCGGFTCSHQQLSSRCPTFLQFRVSQDKSSQRVRAWTRLTSWSPCKRIYLYVGCLMNQPRRKKLNMFKDLHLDSGDFKSQHDVSIP